MDLPVPFRSLLSFSRMSQSRDDRDWQNDWKSRRFSSTSWKRHSTRGALESLIFRVLRKDSLRTFNSERNGIAGKSRIGESVVT